MKTKEEKGITLIALIITVVILLILAGVAISNVINGEILKYSDKAINDEIKGEIEEKANLAWWEAKISGKKTDAEIQEYIDNYLKNSNIKEKYMENIKVVATTEEVKIFDITSGPIINVRVWSKR